MTLPPSSIVAAWWVVVWVCSGCAFDVSGLAPPKDQGGVLVDGPATEGSRAEGLLADRPPADRPPDDRSAMDGPRKERPATDGPPPVLDPQAACGRPSVIIDDFDDSVTASHWIAAAAGGFAGEMGGQLQLRPAPSTAAAASYRSTHAVILSGDRLRVEVVQTPAATAPSTTTLAAEHDAGNRLALSLSGGQLRALTVVEGVTTVIAQTPFSPVAHRWWQIRQTGNQVYFETSSNGALFTAQGQVAAPAFTGVVYQVLGITTTSAAAVETRFDNFNAGRAAPAVWCKADTLQDAFSDAVVGQEWVASSATPGCVYSESSGAHFTMNGPAALCQYRTARAFDLGASAVYIKVPVITDFAAPLRVFLALEDDAKRQLTIGFVGSNELEMAISATPTTPTWTSKVPYGSAHIWWRIREQSQSVYFETSPAGGGAWTVVKTQPLTFTPQAMHVMFGASASADLTRAIGISIFNYNTP